MDRRTLCLSTLRGTLRATLDLIGQASGDEILDASQWLDALPPVANCGDTALMLASRPAPPPSDSLADLRATLARATALEGAGRYADALALLEPAVEALDELGADSLALDARVRVGRLRDQLGRADAAETLRDAAARALAQGDSVAAADAWLELVSVLAISGGDLDGGADAARLADAVVDNLGRPPSLREASLYQRARLARASGDWAAAADAARESLAIAKSRGGAQLAKLLLLADIYRLRGDGDRALDTAVAARAAIIRRDGAGHPQVGDAHAQVAAIRYQAGDLEGALADYAEAERVYVAAHGPSSPDLGAVYEGIGMVEFARGKLAASEAQLQRALAFERAAGRANHPATAGILTALGSVYTESDRLEKAMEINAEALAILEGALGRDHPDTASALANAGVTFKRAGRLDDARAAYRRAAAVLERELGPDHERPAALRINLGELERTAGNPAAAAAHYDQALNALRRAVPASHPWREYAAIGLALAHAEAGHLEKSADAAREALTLDAETHAPRERAERWATLARALADAPDGLGSDLAARARRDAAAADDGDAQ